MKNCLIFCVLLIISLSINAQPKVTLGKPYPVVDAESKYYFKKGDEILAVKIGRKTIHLQKLSGSKLAFEKIRLYDDFPKNFEIEFVSGFQDKYYVFYSSWDGEHEQLFARQINFEAGTFNGPGVRIISVDQKLAGVMQSSGFFRRAVSEKFDFYFSGDEGLLVVQYRFRPEVKNDAKSYDNIGLNVFDSELNERWSNKVRMPYTERKMNNIDYSVDSRGNAYMVTSVYEDETTRQKKSGSDKPNYHLEILKISAGTKTIVPIRVDLKGNFVNTLKLYEDVKGGMTCTGYYNKGLTPSGVDGIIVFKIGEDNKLYDFKTYEIPVSILNQNVSEKVKKRNEKNEDEDQAEFSSLKLRAILPGDDGTLLLIGEAIFEVVRYQYNALTHTSTSYTIYFYQDMLCTKINADGSLAWMKKLPKRQQSSKGGTFMGFGGGSGSSLGGMSFHYFFGAGKHYLLYLDNKKNMDLSLDKVPAIHLDGEGGFLFAYAVDDATGDVNKISVLDTRDVNGMPIYQFTPRRIKNIGSSNFVFEAYKKDKEDILVGVELGK